jgi:flagellin-like hook-associated protein FlgL
MASISLTAQMTTNLMSLQSTAKLLGTTQERLATGKKVNSAVDDPVAFFDAQSHYQLANDYASLKNGMSEAVQTIKAATDTIESLTEVLQQMKSVATSVKSATTEAEVDTLEDQYDALVTQLDSLAGDAMYKGINLLGGDTLTVKFNTGTGELAVNGFEATSAANGLTVTGITAATTKWSDGSGVLATTAIGTSISEIEEGITTLRSQAKSLASNLSLVTTRQNFTDKMIATLKVGADNLTLADMNEEGANMLMLQTRQALGIQSLSIASQSAQQVLSLFQ